MRICLLSRHFDLVRNAGLGRVALEVRDRLIERGHDVTTVSTQGEGLVSYLGYTLLGVPARMPHGCDIYHALTPMEGMWLPVMRNGRSVVTFHDLILMTSPESAGAGLKGSGWRNEIGRRYFALAARMASRAKRIICVSEQTRDEVVSLLGADKAKTRVVRSGIRPDLRPLGRSPGPFRIGYLGQLDRRKRVDLLVRAFRASPIDGELVIGGTGADEAELRGLAGDDPRITFLGFVLDEDLPTFYCSLDLFAFTSGIEGYGLPPVEAMACRVPVLMLEDAKIPPEVKDRCFRTGNLARLLSSEDMLDAVLSYVDLEANHTFAKSHDWERCVDDLESVYGELV